MRLCLSQGLPTATRILQHLHTVQVRTVSFKKRTGLDAKYTISFNFTGNSLYDASQEKRKDWNTLGLLWRQVWSVNPTVQPPHNAHRSPRAVVSLRTSGPSNILFAPPKRYAWEAVDFNGEMEMAVREWLQIQEPDCYRNGIFKLGPRWNKCINVLVDWAAK